MKKYIEKYIENLKNIRGYSINTAKGYHTELLKYETYLSGKKISFEHITKEEIWEYLKYLDELGYSSRSIAKHITSIRSFYQYLKEEKIIPSNIFKMIHNPKLKKSLPNVLNHEEIRILLDFEEPKNAWEAEEILIFELLYATGIRVSELSNIEIKNIDKKERTIRVTGKGNKERIVFFGSFALQALEKYLSMRSDLLSKGDVPYLLINQRGTKLSRSSIEAIISKRVKKIALQHHLSAHTLSHTFATHMLENGANIRTVQELLGHEQLGTTEIYTHLTPEYLRHEYLSKLPRK